MREVVPFAGAQGLALAGSDIDEQMAWTEATPDIRTSMQVDRERGRAMETDALVGVVVHTGRELGVPTPLREVLYPLLTAIEGPRPQG